MSRAAAFLLFCAAAGAQTFTVASLKPSALRDAPPMIMADPGRIRYDNVPLKMLITRAYGVKDYQVEGPEWIAVERYSLNATTPPGSSDADIRAMIRNLLSERFDLKIHRASKEMAVYALVPAGGGPKLTKSDGGEMTVRMRAGRLEGHAMAVWNLTNLLGGLVDRPVVDQTGLEGIYDLALEFAPDASLGPGAAKMSMEQKLSTGGESSGASIFTALQSQLGLKLEAKKAAVEIVIVDSAKKVPSDN